MLTSAALLVLLAGQTVGNATPQGTWVPTGQWIAPAGKTAILPVRPNDVLFGDGILFTKDNRGVTAVLASSMEPLGSVETPNGTSLHGLVWNKDQTRLLATNSASGLVVLEPNPLKVERTIPLGNASRVGGPSYGCGLAVNGDKAYVALSRGNELGVVDLPSGTVERRILVDIAPFDVALSADGKTALVTCWSRRARTGEKTATSSGTGVPVTGNGIATNGTLCFVDLERSEVVARINVGLQPSQIVVASDGKAYLANSNSDSISVVDVAARKLLKVIVVKPDLRLSFGSAPNSLVLSPDERQLFVACGGNNAVAVLDRATDTIVGWIPTGWYPTGLAATPAGLAIAAPKGVGSRGTPKTPGVRGVYDFTGTVSLVPWQEIAANLAEMTGTVMRQADVPRLLNQYARARSGVNPVPVPARPGEPSVFEHVVYILKENRTYDEVLGDLPQGNGDPKLLLFGRDVTPNHHALAEQFVLLDNFYCNGVLSADGHSWAMEGNVTSYLERSFGGFTRSYPFGDDPLNTSAPGFIWDRVLATGRTFRNFGEFDYATPNPTGTFSQIYDDFVRKTGKFTFRHNIGVERLRNYSSREYPGWNMLIPDVLRAAVFLKEFREMERRGVMPNLTIIYLPQDHASGSSAGMPTPKAHLADNDLAMGRIVEAISRSRFWPKTAIFVMEDDPQAGLDHVDGHRSPAFVISPYTKRKTVVSNFYNQTSMVHTMLRILGCAPSTQMDARAPLMTACFTAKPNLTPYRALTPKQRLDELNPKASTLRGNMRKYALLSATLDLSKPDLCDEDLLNRIVWHSVRGNQRYPEEWAGAHGRGLRGKGLKLDPKATEDDD